MRQKTQGAIRRDVGILFAAAMIEVDWHAGTVWRLYGARFAALCSAPFVLGDGWGRA